MAVADTPSAKEEPPLEESNGNSAKTIQPSTSSSAPLQNLPSNPILNSTKPADVEVQRTQRSFSQVVQGFNRPSSSMERQPDLALDSFFKPISILKGHAKPDVLDSDDITLNPISQYQGKPSVIFSSLMKSILVDKLRYVLVGKFTHGRPALSVIKDFFNGLRLHGACNSSILDKKHIFIECSCKVDYCRIWLKLIWFIQGYAMRVLKWIPDFSPLKEPSIAPVWIRIEGLPLYMFEELPLLSIANSIGKPIRVDPRNVNRTILNSARICVELDVSKPLKEDVWISIEDEKTKKSLEGFWVKVFYDLVPLFCSFCFYIGHDSQCCKRRIEGTLSVPTNGNIGMTKEVNMEAIMGQLHTNAAGQKNGHGSLLDLDRTGKDGTSVNKEVQPSLQGASAAVSLKGTVQNQNVHGNGEVGGNAKDLQQLDGMLANKLFLYGSNATVSKKSVKPNVQKQVQRQSKVYQAKKQPILPSESLEDAARGSAAEADPGTLAAGVTAISLETDAGTAAARENDTRGSATEALVCCDLSRVCHTMKFSKQGKEMGIKAQEELQQGNHSTTALVSAEYQERLEAAQECNSFTPANQVEMGENADGNPVENQIQISEEQVAAGEHHIDAAGDLGCASAAGSSRQPSTDTAELDAGETENQTEAAVLLEAVLVAAGRGIGLPWSAGDSTETATDHVPGTCGENMSEHMLMQVEGEADSRTAGQKHDRAVSDVLVEECLRPSKQQVEELTELMNRLRGKEPDRRDVRLPEKDDYAKREMKTILSRPSEVAKLFDTSLPFDFDPTFSDDEGNTVTWSELTRSRLKILASRSLSPVGRSSEKLSKLRTKVDHLKCDERTAIIFEKEYYKELDDRLNEDQRQQVSAFKEQRKASSTKISTEIVTQEKITDTSQVDEQDWTPVTRKGQNRNRKK